jgi:hypothetical protein
MPMLLAGMSSRLILGCTMCPRGTLKLKKKEFSDVNQESMRVNEYLNQFIQLSRYSIDDVNTDEKKQYMFLKGLNDEIQFQLLNTDYPDFQHLVDKAHRE